MFGFPRVVQSDQGSNFISRLFSQVLKQLSIQHSTSSAYHPESQGALERFHQTLKTMLKIYYKEFERDWDDGIPLGLRAFAVLNVTSTKTEGSVAVSAVDQGSLSNSKILVNLDSHLSVLNPSERIDII